MKNLQFGSITTQGGPFFQEALNKAESFELIDFDPVRREEHQHVDNHQWPSPSISLAGIATRTQIISLGTNIVWMNAQSLVQA